MAGKTEAAMAIRLPPLALSFLARGLVALTIGGTGTFRIMACFMAALVIPLVPRKFCTPALFGMFNETS